MAKIPGGAFAEIVAFARPGGDAASAVPVDVAAIRVVSIVRVTIAIGAAAVGSFLPRLSPRHALLFMVFELVWVPVATAVLFASDRPRSAVATFGGPASDVAVFATLSLVAPATRPMAAVACLAVIAFATYTAGRAFGAALGAAAGLAVVVPWRVGPAFADHAGVIAGFVAAGGALVLILGRAARLEAEAATRTSRLHEKSEAILARIADGVVVTDPSGRIVECNPAAARILGNPEGQTAGACAQVLGLHIGERALDCSRGCPLLLHASDPDTPLGLEVWRLDATGRRQPLLANASPVVDTDDMVVEVVHSIRDVTRIKQAEEAKTLFLATASHELKTPLTVISGFAEALARFDIDRDGQEAGLEAIRRRAAELTKIVDRLLLSSRIEAGRVKLSAREVAVGPLLTERTASLATATARDIRTDLEGGLPLVLADEEALTTVVDHLLDNAVKYSPDKGAIVVRARALADVVLIEVEDQGIGMDAEQAAQCFDKFWQAESTDVRRFGGTGIGLYIVRSLAEAMGGEVAVRSKPGLGTTFDLRVPQVRTLTAAALRPGLGELSSIREFMRQIGVPAGGPS